MRKYRAIRLPKKSLWHIEEWDEEFGVSSIWNIRKYAFSSKEDAEHYIVNEIKRDNGEVGEWI